jgi:hypothetical protein
MTAVPVTTLLISVLAITTGFGTLDFAFYAVVIAVW